ncbi:MAG: tetratricopeptide repeat protein [Treponema sp.]|jgi:tetratricopeptide (TPR) repeat protein|nr:tetratricopeptide repeat protein [Treponema sp.]
MAENRIVFLAVPESLRGQIESHRHTHLHDDEQECLTGEAEEFSIDPAIPIPVELPPGEDAINLEELSWEMILSGMLRVITRFPPDTEIIRGEPSEFSPLVISAEQIDYYRRFVLAVKPDIRREFTEAAILKAKNGDFDMALEIFDALGGLFPGAPDVPLNRALVLEERAEALERSGREEAAEAENREAEKAYEAALAVEPPFPNSFFNAGFFYLKLRDFGRARKYFSRYAALADDPDKKEKAESIIREITEKALDDETFREAYERIREGKEREGLERIRDFLERHPDVWNGWFTLGWALRRLERWEDGAAAFRKAASLREAREPEGDSGDTHAADIRNELAICLMELNDYPGARRELEAALRYDPGNVKVISNLGVLALKTGDDDEAAGFFRTVLELAPHDPVAGEYLTTLGLKKNRR